MPNPQAPTTGTTMVKISSEDPCGNYTSGEREVTVVQNLIAGRYISIVEDGNTAEISADPSEGYYNKNEINEIFSDLDTVQFRIVAALPAIGAGNVIYLVKQEAPLTGYLQYIWNTDDRAYHAIGNTDIDLADYYTKIQADDKFQEKLTYSDPLLRVTDSTEMSQVNLTTKKVKQMTAFNIWEYLKTKLVPGSQTAVSDSTQFSEVNGNNTDVVKNTTGLAIWNYIKSKIGNDTIAEVTDSTKLGSVDGSKDNIVQETTALSVWNYIKTKFVPEPQTAVSDNTQFSEVNGNNTNVVKNTSGLAIWNYIKGKFGGSMVYPIVDSTRISGIDTSNTNIHSYFSASSLFSYIMDKIGIENVSTMTDATTVADFSPSATNQVKRITGSTIWAYILTKLTTAIGSTSTNLQVPSNKAVYDYVEARRRYLHILERKNNDSLQYPMGWVAIITENASETYGSIAQWLYNNQYRSLENSYYWVGGCCGTTGVRNQQDTGTAYIGRVTSGAFSEDGTTITFKYDYNGTVGFQANRAVVHSHPLMKLTT